MILLRQNLLKNCVIHPGSHGEMKPTQSEGLFLSSGAFLSLLMAALTLMRRRAFIFLHGVATSSLPGASAAMLHNQSRVEEKTYSVS